MSRLRAVVLLSLCGATLSAVADPPPYPRYKITNSTPWTISAIWVADYIPMGMVTFDRTVGLEGTLAPGQSVERSVPDRIPHLCMSISNPCIQLRMARSPMKINGTLVEFKTMTMAEAYPCNGQQWSDLVVPPDGHAQQFGKYGSNCVKIKCDGGSSDPTSRDYFDCEILP